MSVRDPIVRKSTDVKSQTSTFISEDEETFLMTNQTFYNIDKILTSVKPLKASLIMPAKTGNKMLAKLENSLAGKVGQI